MLKNKFNIILIFSLASMLFVSCDDFLSELPDNRTIIDSPEQISELLTGAYPNDNYMLFAELMSDNAGFKSLRNDLTLDLQQQVYEWEVPDFNQNQRDSPVAFWEDSYKSIAQANEALALIKDLEGDFDLKAQKGEALLVRAYSHFMLVNFWAKHYDAATASTDLGIPYVLEPETTLIKEYKRNTVQEVYDFIEKDIIDGLALVENNYEQPKFHFTKDAGNALAVRFYTYKGDWDNVIKFANKVLTNPIEEIRDDAFLGSTLSSEALRHQYGNKDERANILITSPTSLWQRNSIRGRYGMNAEINGMFTSNNPFNKRWAYRIFTRGTGNFFVSKFEEYFRFTNPTTRIGVPYCAIVLFDKDEVLLNRAEAYAMKENYVSAVKDLSDFVSKKTRLYNPATDILDEALIVSQFPVIANEYEPYYTLNTKQASFVKAIAEYRRREYFHEGLRWFDVRRFNIKVEHITDDSGTNVLTLEKDDPKRQLQIPIDAIAAGITPNPR